MSGPHVDESLHRRLRFGGDPAIVPDVPMTTHRGCAMATDALGRRPGWVRVALRSTPEGVLVEVRDSGPGVAPELADEVFRHGFTTKIAQSGGTRGLGLALARQACVRRGGWVQVRNDDGAVFTALLPPVRVGSP